MQKVMIVENNDELRLGIKAFLEIAGYEAIEAVNGQQAASILHKAVPDIIISEITMPHMNGLELLWKVRDNNRSKQVPFILMMDKAEAEDMKPGIEAGRAGVIIKPFSIAAILMMIKNILSN